jgi:ABC-type Zn uptake system ZnuABC Zn-binding protein ZnuA
MGADVVLASGAGLDEWVSGLVDNAGGGAKLVEVAPVERLKPDALDEGEAFDPHFWHAPTLAVDAVDTIEQTLAAADPANADTYAANAGAYVAKIDALDAELKAEFDTVPADARKMVTDHDAFGYLADRYGLTVVGAAIPSTSTAADPNAKEMAELVDTIRGEGVCSVFSESSVDPKLLDQIAAESGATVYPDLFGDTLGPEGSGAATYLEMMRHNAQVLVDGFSC